MNEKTTLRSSHPLLKKPAGLSQLGLTARSELEVLDTGNKGLFGLGKPQVRVRLTVNAQAEEASVEPAASGGWNLLL
jgi:hypothetical protein